MQYCNALLLKVTFPNTGDNVNKEEEKLTGVIECTHTELTWHHFHQRTQRDPIREQMTLMNL